MKSTHSDQSGSAARSNINRKKRLKRKPIPSLIEIDQMVPEEGTFGVADREYGVFASRPRPQPEPDSHQKGLMRIAGRTRIENSGR